MADAGWEFWIDVGGTFTDTLARAPDGHTQRLKLLSSGVVKGQVADGSSSDAIVDRPSAFRRTAVLSKYMHYVVPISPFPVRGNLPVFSGISPGGKEFADRQIDICSGLRLPIMHKST